MVTYKNPYHYVAEVLGWHGNIAFSRSNIQKSRRSSDYLSRVYENKFSDLKRTWPEAISMVFRHGYLRRYIYHLYSDSCVR